MVDIRLKPSFSVKEVRAIISREYGLDGVTGELASERDQNFLVQGADGQNYVLKIANPTENQTLLQFENKVLAHLAQNEASLPVPRLVTNVSGQDITKARDENGREYFARVITFLPGKPLARVRNTTQELYRDLGQKLARMDIALDALWDPIAKRDFTWSIYQASRVISQYIHELNDWEERSIIELFLARFDCLIAPRLGLLPSGVIHSDANDYNLLVQENVNTGYEVSAILDFGDLIWGPYIFEPAVAAAYAMADQPDPLGVAAEILAGYHEEFPRNQIEIEAYFDLISIRLCTSVVMAAHQRKLMPDHAYLSISQEQAWSTLRYLIALDPGKARRRFLAACDLGTSITDAADIPLIERRKKIIGPSLSISYQRPLHIIRGFRQYLFDESGRAYLDAVNNVAHVGHSHPKVVRAGQEQMAVLNTNTRYLHDGLVQYAERICATMPDPLQVCYFVCSGSEANELALRIARVFTGQDDVIVLEGAYHGNTATLIDISPYKFNGPGGSGAPEHVHSVLMPDRFRGPYKYADRDAGKKYAADIQAKLEVIENRGRGVAAFICESLLGCGGQIVLPDGYLNQAYTAVRRAGGICIADEVQVGFGRVGTHYWGFETQGVTPDIVTLGKPIGNGHPMAAVVTTLEIADAFDNGMEYFNTFGGNPVSCAIGMAVMDVIEQEGLQENARIVGSKLISELRALQQRHAMIGDVRGLGLFVGVELVRDRDTLEPASEEATRVIEFMKHNGILVSTDGPFNNVLKIKPPMVFTETNALKLVFVLDEALQSITE